MVGLNRTEGFLVVTPYLNSSSASVNQLYKANIYYTTSLAFVVFISGSFSLPLSLLVYVQTINLLYKTTTNKRFSKHGNKHN
jgi:hypothetical protein